MPGNQGGADGVRKRLLLISHVNPVTRRSGQQQRVYYSLVALRKHFHVTFVGFAAAEECERLSKELLPLCDAVELLPSAYARTRMSKGWHRLAGWFYQRRTGLKFSNYVIGKVELTAARLAPLVARCQYDLAVFEYFHTAEAAGWLRQRGIPCVLDMHNILWQSFARQLEGRGISGEAKARAVARYRSAEEAAWHQYEGLIAISEGERDYVRSRLVMGQQLFYAPMGIPLECWPYLWSPVEPRRVGYYGGLGSPHNAQDARRCYERIMPEVWRTFPEAELWLVGSNPPEDLRALAARDPRVKVTGFVENVQSVLSKISVLLCPFTGTYGFRSRVIEAMALGVPVAASPDAVYGMALKSGAGLFLSESDAGLATAARQLLSRSDFAATHSRAAREQIERNYSFASTYGRLAAELFAFVGVRGVRRTKSGREISAAMVDKD